MPVPPGTSSITLTLTEVDQKDQRQEISIDSVSDLAVELVGELSSRTGISCQPSTSQVTIFWLGTGQLRPELPLDSRVGPFFTNDRSVVGVRGQCLFTVEVTDIRFGLNIGCHCSASAIVDHKGGRGSPLLSVFECLSHPYLPTQTRGKKTSAPLLFAKHIRNIIDQLMCRIAR